MPEVPPPPPPVRRRLLTALVALVALSSCTDGSTNPTEEVARSPLVQQNLSAGSGLAITAAAENVARLLALAMGQSEVRAAVLAAMRDSEASEHKLLLQRFLASPAGSQIYQALQQSGGSPGELRAELAALPALQFYVPIRSQRLSWEGDGNVVVVPQFEAGPTVSAYATDGTRSSLILDRARLPEQTLFLLQVAEPMARRLSVQRGSGSTIQEPGERDMGAVLLRRGTRDPFADSVFIDGTVGTLSEGECDPEVALEFCNTDPGGGGGGGLKLVRLVNNGVEDGTPFESLEFEMRAMPQSGGSETILRLTGISPFDDWQGSMLVSTQFATTQWIDVHTFETDGFPNPDDNFFCLNGGAPLCSPNGDPRIGPVPFGWTTVLFPLCEDFITTCAHAPSDLLVQFKN